jgi:hypothetical protein
MKDILLAIIPATIPTLAVLAGILLHQNGINRLDQTITASESRLDGRINGLAGEIAALRKQLHDNIVMLIGRDTDKSERLARLEERIAKNRE